jgi:hypothetical protein
MALSWTPTPGTAAGPSMPGARAPLDTLPTGVSPAFEQLAQRIRAEYREMPGLNVTRAQARCLWALDPDVCDRVLAHLVQTGFLAYTAQHTYVRAA